MTNSTSTAITHGDENDVDALRAALFGRSVVSVNLFGPDEPAPKVGRYGEHAQGRVLLDDGTVLYLAGNEGGCACSAGDYFLTRLNDMPVNGITNVEVQVDDSKVDPKWGEGEQTYSIFVLAMDGSPVELAAFEGDDGNGYYGTGFWFSIVPPPPPGDLTDSGKPLVCESFVDDGRTRKCARCGWWRTTHSGSTPSR